MNPYSLNCVKAWAARAADHAPQLTTPASAAMPATPFTPLRRASLRRWVLAWVLLAWGCAWAAPLVQPVGLDVVCSADGTTRLVVPDLPEGAAGHGGECPLCLPPALVCTPVVSVPVPIAAADHGAAASLPSPRTALAGAPLPARGPPTA